MPPLSVVRALLLILVLLLIFEFANIYIITNILGKEKFDLLMNDTLYMNIIGLPSSFTFALFCATSYYLLVIRTRKKRVAHGEVRA
jgi:uncharacterized BrkB/YihY/UPF0761 family membrane protein